MYDERGAQDDPYEPDDFAPNPEEDSDGDSAEASPNPYHPRVDGDYSDAPFAGRTVAFARLHQQLVDNTTVGATVFMGRRHVGKTALLQRFGKVFDENFIGVIIPLEFTLLKSESDWLLTLADAMTLVLARRGFMLTRLPQPPEEDDQIRHWLTDRFLPEVFTTIRPHRRLVLLLDDADEIADSVAHGKLPEDTFTYLYGLINKHRQLSMALTVGADHETRLHVMNPLVTPARVLRLANLTADESRQLLQEPAHGLYAVGDDATELVYRASGGEPLLLQRFGFHLYRRWQSISDLNSDTLNIATTDDVKTMLSVIYVESEEEFKTTWEQLNGNERLVMMAISNLLYNDPLRPITNADISAWLVETDYLMDMTAINSARRGLEYREIIHHVGEGVQLSAGLMQTWLLENGRLDGKITNADGMPAPSFLRGRVSWLVALVVLLVFVSIILVLSLNNVRTPAGGASNPVATVTLAGQ